MTPYVSPLREAQAAQTRARILDAASDMFGQHGFTGTSLAKIAERAGVSVETVKLAGSKGALLLAAFDQAFAGKELPGTIHESDIGDELRALPPAQMLPQWVAFVADANARVARLWPRVLDAAAGDADVAERLRRLQDSRAKDMRAAIGFLRDVGRVESTLPDDELADSLSYVLAPEGYVRLVLECGWEMEAYRAWVVRAVERLILAA